MKAVRRRASVGLAAVIFVFAAQVGFGATRYWTSTSSGDFETTGNWLGGLVPGNLDYAFFTNRLAYTVTVNAPVTNTRLRILGGEVTFSAPGNYTLIDPNYPLAVGNLADNSQATNTLIITGSASLTANAQVYLNIKDAAKKGHYRLIIQNGGTLQGSGSLYLGNYGERTGATQSLVVADAGSALNFTAVNAMLDSLNTISVTNGATLTIANNQELGLNFLDGNRSLQHRSELHVGGGLGTSIANASLFVNRMGSVAGDVSLNTSEVFIYPGGLIHAPAAKDHTIAAGGTITLAGGVIEQSEQAHGFIVSGGKIQGTGTLGLAKNQGLAQFVSLRASAGSPTYYGSIAPGTPASPIGTVEIDKYNGAAYLEVRTGCSLDFDLGGAGLGQYDRIVATNNGNATIKTEVYLGTYASYPGTPGGAVINVALANGFVPANGDTFDIIEAQDIVDTDLGTVTFNFPTEPADVVWTPSIETVGANEVLRLTAVVPLPAGTVFMIL